jgi:hypothetical protein
MRWVRDIWHLPTRREMGEEFGLETQKEQECLEDIELKGKRSSSPNNLS